MNTRKATKADIEGIRVIYNHSIVNTTSVYHYDPFSIAQMEDWYFAKTEANLPIIVAELKGQIIGFTTYGSFRPWPAYKYTVEHSIHIHPNHQGKGVSKLLMSLLIEEAVSNNMHTIIAGIDANNTISILLHEKFGFVQTGTLKKVGYKFDKWLDLVFMQLVLTEPTQPTEG